jgi:Repeat of unknown function (DUF5650)
MDAGAVTWGNGLSGTIGTISALNSFVGSAAQDQVGQGENFNPDIAQGVVALSNGNYVFASVNWNAKTPLRRQVGAVTWGNGSTGSAGIISSANSLVGSNDFDRISSRGGIIALNNGNYVFASPYLDAGEPLQEDVGAATWGNGATGTTGEISVINSLMGKTAGDYVGLCGVKALSNSNYVVGSCNWNALLPTVPQVGAATWGNGAVGITGFISEANSLVGSSEYDEIGQITPLSNGNYLVQSKFWDAPSAGDAGAVTWGNGNAGITGTITAANSLVGNGDDHAVGYKIALLSNSNYVIYGATSNGTLTWGSGAVGVTGLVNAQNSLLGAYDVLLALDNGNYVAKGYLLGGSITQCNSDGSTVGGVSQLNSLIGGGVNIHSDIRVAQFAQNRYYIESARTDAGRYRSAINIAPVNGLRGLLESSNPVMDATYLAYNANDNSHILRRGTNTISVYREPLDAIFASGFE